ncbi:exonuclease domain-containing protein [Roseospirillum parvum]|nr:exonuclease domain-containing protein [Roseospirillum parvum]
MSHYFSQMYNTGRMRRDRKDSLTKADGDIAKRLRNEFVADHCHAVWVTLPDTLDIARLEAEILSEAPDDAIAWNRRRMEPYEEPVKLVDATIRRLGWGDQELAAIERQRKRFLATGAVTLKKRVSEPRSNRGSCAPFPTGPFRFFALDVETATHDRASICQIGVACVRPNDTIEIWKTFINPNVDHWAFTYLHGISARTVESAPSFSEVLPVLWDALHDATVYQHSSFDRSAIIAACEKSGLAIPKWDWHDSVRVARSAWPELQGNGGHGLASLKRHLGLVFDHHDAGEDARAAAEVVLCAERAHSVRPLDPARTDLTMNCDDASFDAIRERDDIQAVGAAHAFAPNLKEPDRPAYSSCQF